VLQGLLKGEGKARYGDAWGMWQKQADAFAIDDHAPVRELWYRCGAAAAAAADGVSRCEHAMLCVGAHSASSTGKAPCIPTAVANSSSICCSTPVSAQSCLASC
jgi:hypothetical protein